MKLDTVTYLPDDILVKVDRAAMAVSLETRVPLIDHRVYDSPGACRTSTRCAAAPASGCCARCCTAMSLKRWWTVPSAVSPCRWPPGCADRCATGPALLDPARLRQEGWFEPEPILRKWREHVSGHRNWDSHLWGVLMMQAWLDRYRGAVRGHEAHEDPDAGQLHALGRRRARRRDAGQCLGRARRRSHAHPTYSSKGSCFYPLSDKVRLAWLADLAGTRASGAVAAFKRLLTLRRHVRDTRPDVVVSFLTNVNVAAILATRGLRAADRLRAHQSHRGHHHRAGMAPLAAPVAARRYGDRAGRGHRRTVRQAGARHQAAGGDSQSLACAPARRTAGRAA